MHRVHLRIPVLLVDFPLLLHLARRVAVLLDVHLVRDALLARAIDLFAKLQDAALVLTEAALHAAHAQAEGIQSPAGLCAAELRLLRYGAVLLEGLLLLLPDVLLQARLNVSSIARVLEHRDPMGCSTRSRRCLIRSLPVVVLDTQPVDSCCYCLSSGSHSVNWPPLTALRQ